MSPSATVSAHIPPRPDLTDQDPQAGDKNLIAKMHEFARLYRENEMYFSSYNVSLIYPRFQGKAEEWEKPMVKGKIDGPGI